MHQQARRKTPREALTFPTRFTMPREAVLLSPYHYPLRVLSWPVGTPCHLHKSSVGVPVHVFGTLQRALDLVHSSVGRRACCPHVRRHLLAAEQVRVRVFLGRWQGTPRITWATSRCDSERVHGRAFVGKVIT